MENDVDFKKIHEITLLKQFGAQLLIWMHDYPDFVKQVDEVFKHIPKVKLKYKNEEIQGGQDFMKELHVGLAIDQLVTEFLDNWYKDFENNGGEDDEDQT